jgi:hypothetical protein
MYPWHFVAVLTGIENRAKNQIAYLRNRNRADLLLAAVAVGQIVTRDGGVTKEWLDKATNTLGRDNIWAESSLEELRRIRIVLGTERIRCPHLRFAGTALTAICEDSIDDVKGPLIPLLRAAVLDPSSSLQGITWLLNELKYAGGLGPDGYGPVIDDAVWRELTTRCKAASTGEVRREASLLLGTLLDWHSNQLQFIKQHSDLFGRWLDEGDINGIAGVSWLLHNLKQQAHRFPDAPEVAEQICSYADPSTFAAKFAKITWSEASTWGWALLNIVGACSEEWKDRLAASIDVDALTRLASTATTSKLYPFNSLVSSMLALNETLGIDVMYHATPLVAAALNEDPLGAFEQIQHELEHKYWLLSSLARRGASGRHVDAVRNLDRLLDTSAIARVISNSRTRREWDLCWGLLYFVKVVLPRKAVRIVRQIDFDVLDKAAEGYWGQMPEELTFLLWAISVSGGRDLTEAWVARHEDKIQEVNVRLLETMPRVVARRVTAGATFGPPNHPWVAVRTIIPLLASVDVGAARLVAENHVRAIAYTLSHVPLNLDSFKDFEDFLSLLEQLCPGVVNRAFNTIKDTSSAEHQWAAVLREGNRRAKKAVRAVLRAAAATQSPVTDVAKRLLDKPPRGRRSK